MRFRVCVLAILLGAITASAAYAQTQAVVFVPELATVRSGPGTVYDRLGELTAEMTAPAVGRSAFSDWIEIEYVTASGNRGWVYAAFVELRGTTLEALPVAEAPPTATLPPTPEGESNPFETVATAAVRLPTFTPAQEVEVPTYTEAAVTRPAFPAAALILALAAVGVFGMVMAVIRRKA